MQGAAIAIEQADSSKRPSRRFALILSANQPPASRPMAPTAPSETADTLLAPLRLISWNRWRNGVWKALMAYMLKLWKMPDRMIHHMVGNFSTAAYGDFIAASLEANGRAASKAPRTGSGRCIANQANSRPGKQANRK